MAASQLVSTSLELALNQALQWSSNGDELLNSLAGKRCIIFVQELSQALIFSFKASSQTLVAEDIRALQNTSDSSSKNKYVEVCIDHDGIYHEIPEELEDNTCWISISIFAIDKLKENNQLTKLIKAGQLDFAGDLSILQSLSRLFDKLDIDFEEVLSAYIGDAPAYQLNATLKQFTLHAQTQFKQFSQTLSDAALDEKPIGVRKIMIINFVDEVNQLRTDVDRLEARLSILEESNKLKDGRKPS